MTAVTEEPGLPSRLIGRDREIEQLHAWLDEAISHGAGICLTGSAGVGKTSVLHAVAARAYERGATVLRLNGSEFQADISLAGLDRLVAPLQPLISTLAADHGHALSVSIGLADGQVPSELMLCTAVLALLYRASLARPLVVLIDDAQWLDTASKVVLTFAARRVSGTRIGIAFVVRTGTDELIETARLATLDVAPLDDAASAELLGERYPALAPHVAQRILDEAEGNPLALVEVPSNLTEAQRRGHVDLPAILPVGQRLGAMFAPRVAALPPETRQVLLRLALDDEASRGTLQDLDDASANAVVAAAEDVGIVLGGSPQHGVPFRHPLARAAVVEVSSDLERRRAHRYLAQKSPPRSPRQVWHLAAATVTPDLEIAMALEILSRECLRRGDARGALAAMVRAAQLTPEDGARARRYLNAAIIGADVTGDLVAAAELVSAADDALSGSASSLDAAVAAAHLMFNGEGEVDGAHRLLVDAIAGHDNPTDATDATLLDALHTLVMLSWWGGRPALWEPVRAAVERLQPAPPPTLDLCTKTFGDPVRLAARMLATAQAVISQLPLERNPVEITRAAIGLVYVDRVTDSREALWRVIRDGRAGGAVALAINAVVSSCVDDWLTGQWNEALHLAAEGEQLSQQYGYRRYSFLLGGYITALVTAARGDVDRAGETARELAEWGKAKRAEMAVHFASHIRTVQALAADRFDDAYRHASSISTAGELRPYSPHALWVALDLVEAAVRSNRMEAAAAHVAAMQAADLPAISSRLALVTLGCAAMVAESDTADELYARALGIPDADRWPFEHARIRMAYGEHLRGTRRMPQSQTEFELALHIFDRLGATPWSARAADALRSTGLPVMRAARAPSDITAHQWRIAHLAAAGLTNRQIGERLSLSHRSVGATLYQLFPKLGITSRAGLRAALDALATATDANDEKPATTPPA